MWVSFGSYLLNSTANPAQFEWKWAGFFPNFQDIFFKIISLRTIALTFLTLIISAIGGVKSILRSAKKHTTILSKD